MRQIHNALFILMVFTAFVLLPASLMGLTGEEIVRRADEAQTFDTAVSTGELRMTDRFGLKVSTFKAWSRGEDKSLIEFTSTAERGQKVLRTEDEIYLFYPDADELIRMQGSALRQGMLGSDISYEDMTGGKDRLSKYSIELQGEETVSGRPCYVVFMTANTRTVPYPQQKLWIDKENYIVWKGEYYTKSGRLLKEMETLETEEYDGRVVPIKTRISDKMKEDSETVMVVDDLEINVPIDESRFSIQELSW